MTYVKTFRRFMTENKDSDKWYSVDFDEGADKREIVFYMNQLLPFIIKMTKSNDVRVIVEPLLDSEEEQ